MRDADRNPQTERDEIPDIVLASQACKLVYGASAEIS